jgi:nuclear pore complex protein Nup155
LKAARILDFDQTRHVVGDYQHLNFAKGKSSLSSKFLFRQSFAGAIEFPISCAQIVDPDSIGIEFWQAGLPVNDQRAQYYEQRLKCYDLALDSITLFEEKCNEAKKQPGNSSQVKEAEAARIEAYQLALSSEDELFHASFYDWLAKKGMADELLDVRRNFWAALPYTMLDACCVRRRHRSWKSISGGILHLSKNTSCCGSSTSRMTNPCERPRFWLPWRNPPS